MSTINRFIRPTSEPLTLGQKQRLFCYLVAELIVFAYNEGYELTFGEAWRTPEQAALNAKNGVGIANSLHTRRLAIDLNLFRDVDSDGTPDYLTDSEDYATLGAYWKTLHPLCRWGGDFSRPDGNHFSLEHEGVK